MDRRPVNLPALVDTHCHLDFEDYDADRDAVVKRARQAGLVRIVNPGIDLPTCRAALRLAEKYPEVFAAIGVHPNSAANPGRPWAEARKELHELAQHPRVVAIGEIGLDYYRERAPHALQMTVLREQLELAAELGLPVIIHTRNASRDDRRCQLDALIQLEAWVKGLHAANPALARRPGVLHAFSGEAETARQAIRIGLRLGIGGPLTFQNAAALQQTVAGLPLETLVIETDAPFLSPHPRRGQRNEPASCALVAGKLAALKNLPVDTIARQTTANAVELFDWRDPVD